MMMISIFIISEQCELSFLTCFLLFLNFIKWLRRKINKKTPHCGNQDQLFSTWHQLLSQYEMLLMLCTFNYWHTFYFSIHSLTLLQWGGSMNLRLEKLFVKHGQTVVMIFWLVLQNTHFSLTHTRTHIQKITCNYY